MRGSVKIESVFNLCFRHGILTTRMLLADVGSREKKASCFVNAVQLLTKPHTTKEGTFRPFIEGVRVCSNLFAQVVGITISRYELIRVLIFISQ